MKICIAADGPNLSSFVSPAFGRAPYFILFDLEEEDFEYFANSGLQAGRGAGVAAAQLVLSKRAEVVVCGNLGPNAFHILKSSNIKICSGEDGITVSEAISRYKNGATKETITPTTSSGFGAGFGHGMGFGRGPNRHRHHRR